MISRLAAVALIRQHSIEPNACVVGGTHNCWDHVRSDPCESFNSAFENKALDTGPWTATQYKRADIMNWLGY